MASKNSQSKPNNPPPVPFKTPEHPGKSIAIVSPMDWGLGHAARCIPLIKQLQTQGYKVVAAGSGRSIQMLRAELKDITIETFQGKEILYSKRIHLVAKLLWQMPKFVFNFRKEKKAAENLYQKYTPEIIVSDNRYGFRHPETKSIFLTHQISPRLPRAFSWAAPLIKKLHIRLIKPFDNCFIPDFAGTENLSGALSHGFFLPPKFQFINPLSRFTILERYNVKLLNNRVLALVSGPEPQRTNFLKIILQQASTIDKEVLILTGAPEADMNYKKGNCTIVNHKNSAAMYKEILSSAYVVSRAGYSSIMDFFVLNKKAVLIPTPGQTEQEYLAKYLKSNKNFIFFSQNKFSLKKADEIFCSSKK